MKKILENKRNVLILIFGIICMVAVVVGITFAYIAYYARQKSINTLATDCIKIEYKDKSNAISLNNARPMTNEDGTTTVPYVFEITNVCNVGVDYNVNLEILTIKEGEPIENILESKNIATKIDNLEMKQLTSEIATTPTYDEIDYKATESYILYKGILNPRETKEHSLRIWLHESAGNETQNKNFYSKVVIEGIQNEIVDNYKEEILNGADPVLADNLIPVTIDNSGVVRKANEKEEWYSYTKKQWANAVILEDESVTYNVNDIIPEENIESYFVWIPKYSYQLWDLGEYESLSTLDESKVHEIPVRFGLTDTSDSKAGECTTPMNEERTQGLSGENGNCKVGDYITHPAFISMNTNGLWVGKFESSYKGATSKTEAEKNENNPEKLEIKPNVYSWRGIQVSNAHLTSYNYKRELDSHMMKNTEWGAVAYLQHSFYGSSKSVRINNNESYITGYASVKEPTCGNTGTNEECNKYEGTILGVDGSYTINYKNPSSVVASTTGNYTGVYDVSGGSFENMLSVILDKNKMPMSGTSEENNSGFAGTNYDDSFTNGIDFPNKKYFDVYSYEIDSQNYKNRILGDATGEMGPFETKRYYQSNQVDYKDRPNSSWYNDETMMVIPFLPWSVKGGLFSMGNGTGMFFSRNYYGNAAPEFTFRVVLAP